MSRQQRAAKIAMSAAAAFMAFACVAGGQEKRKTPAAPFLRPDVALMRNNSVPLIAVPESPRDEPKGSYRLTAREAEMVIPDPAQPGGRRNVKLYSYNGHPVGPVLYAEPGRKLSITLINELPPKPKDEPLKPVENVPHGFHLTNLHTHGLNVTPRDPGDNVLREIPSPGSHKFTYELPADHPPGTFFYHPHRHGSVGYQVGCGMVGAIVVRDESRGLDAVPEIKRATEQVLVFQQLPMKQEPGSSVWTLTPTQFYSPDRPSVVAAINGQVAPLITLKRKEVVRWRLVHGGIEDRIFLTFAAAAGGDGPTPLLHQVARDGIPFLELVKPTVDETKNCLDLAPGYRAEVLVQAPDADGDFLLISAPLTAKQSLRNIDRPAVPLAYVKVSGPAGTAATKLPSDASLAHFTRPCVPLPVKESDVFVRRTFELRSDDNSNTFEINRQPFDSDKVRQVFLKDSAEEWNLRAFEKFNGHPFHVHVNPFQVVAVDGKKIDRPYWADTLFVPEKTTYTVRTRFRNWDGMTVLHCHILDHEDAGMMQKIEIADPAAMNRAAANGHLASRPLPLKKLAAIDGIGLDFGKPVPATVLVFFEGPNCPTCVRQIRSFVEARRKWSDGKTRLIAVSSSVLRDPSGSRKTIWAAGDEPVHLCQDPELAIFRQMGCEDDGPLHGTFVVCDERVLWSHVGFSPFSDASFVAGVLSGR